MKKYFNYIIWTPLVLMIFIGGVRQVIMWLAYNKTFQSIFYTYLIVVMIAIVRLIIWLIQDGRKADDDKQKRTQ